MTGAEWIADKVNAFSATFNADVESGDVVYIQRHDKPNAHIGVVPNIPRNAAPLIGVDDIKAVHAQRPTMQMVISIPRGAR